ncbi:hypothetical protein B7486_04795 [cyanobacterium TDX16]|nr:hypothetical protein B7486_04795 [cyanobacterium TDX16]
MKHQATPCSTSAGPRGRLFTRAFAFILAMSALSPARLGAQAVLDVRAEPEDKLAAEERKLVQDLTRRRMPELVEALLRNAPKTYYVHIARAYAQAAPEASEQAINEKFTRKAASYYRKAIALEKSSKWFKGLRRSFDVCDWRIEYAEFILRQRCAPDLDRFEMTSGLDFNRSRLVELLEDADSLLEAASVRLDDFKVGMRTREQDFLLLGLGNKIPRLAARHAVISAWTKLYLGQIECAAAPSGKNRLLSALDAFDRITSTSKDDTSKYNAAIGVGIALRELRRYPESEIAFNRVIDSTAASAIQTRARHEKARLFLVSGNTDKAQKEWNALAAAADSAAAANEAFYLGIAPLMLAYSDLLASQSPQWPPSEQLKHRERATSALNKIATQGGAWHELAGIYLGLLDIRGQDFSRLGDDEIFSTASRLMENDRMTEAIEAWQTLLKRPLGSERNAHVRFNLGICHLAQEMYAEAADAMDQALADGLPPKQSERAAEVAYQCRRMISGEHPSPDAHRKLAESAERLVNSFPDSKLADEGRWVIGLALKEAGDVLLARQAFARVPPSSEHYWDARRGEAICAQKIHENELGRGTQASLRRSAEVAVDLWRRFADDLKEIQDRTPAKGSRNSSRHRPSAELLAQWQTEARVAAAALLASEAVGDFAEALILLNGAAADARSVGLRLRCLRATGQSEAAKQELSSFLKHAADGGSPDAVLNLAVGFEREMDSLIDQGRLPAAKEVAQDAVPLLIQLLQQVKESKDGELNATVIETSLARALGIAGEIEQSRERFDRLIAESPANGAIILAAARTEERISTAWTGEKRDEAAERAESLWAQLLRDAGLRERSPDHYWEARSYWFAHLLRHGRADDVIKGIESEQAWHPELGGSPWKDRLLTLSAEARRLASDRNP